MRLRNRQRWRYMADGRACAIVVDLTVIGAFSVAER